MVNDNLAHCLDGTQITQMRQIYTDFKELRQHPFVMGSMTKKESVFISYNLYHLCAN